jgi:uncharacterized protein YndB with AHSA1/START domain
MKISQSVEIDRPAEVVFPWLEDPSRAMQWMTSVTKTEIIENKPDRVGTRFNEVIEEEGSTTEMAGVITEFEKNRRIAFHLKGKFNSVDVTYCLRELEGKTQIFQDAEIRFTGLLRVVSILSGSAFKKKILAQGRAEFARLKEICETAEPEKA